MPKNTAVTLSCSITLENTGKLRIIIGLMPQCKTSNPNKRCLPLSDNLQLDGRKLGK